MKTEEKALRFLFALSDVYRDEEDRQLYSVSKLDLDVSDVTEDFTAMLLAMNTLYVRITGDKEADLIDFTHILNKLAVQHIMEGMTNNGAAERNRE